MTEIVVAEGDVFRWTATFLTDGVDVCQWVGSYVCVNAGISDTDDLNEAIKSVLSNAWQVLEGQIVDQVIGSVLELARYDSGGDQWNTISQIPITELEGTGTGSYMPLGVAVLTKFISARAKALGKKYIFGGNENGQDDGQWDANMVSAALSFATVLTGLPVHGAVILAPGVFNQLVQTFNEFTGSVFADSNASYQRRRKPTVGL